MIGYIEIENGTKIGNVKLDFLKSEKETYNTIVLAGENGCGKTAILETIAGFQRGGYLRESSNIKKVQYFDEYGKSHLILRDKESVRYARPERITDEDWEAMCEYTDQDFFKERFELSEKVPYDIRNQALVFSEARSGFEVNLRNDIHSFGYEEEKYEKDGANYSGIVQLLIDLEEKDLVEYAAYAKFHQKCTYEEYMRSNSRTARFKNAFESMFEDVTYMGKDPRIQGNTVYFIKNGQQIDINELSTGEKQIVFRGTDLLFHATSNATIIIDEPELSLHPRWQKKILDFYRNLFLDENGKQTAQIIIATHSQYVVQSAMNDRENVKIVILEKSNFNVKVKEVEDLVLGEHSSAEVNYLVFGVDKIEYHIQLYGALHYMLQCVPGSGVTSTISSIDQYIKNHMLYDSSVHERVDTSHGTYYTIATYIRNAIDHPDSGRSYNEEELGISIELLRNIYSLGRDEWCVY